MYQSRAILLLCVSVEEYSIWDDTHLNRVIRRLYGKSLIAFRGQHQTRNRQNNVWSRAKGKGQGKWKPFRHCCEEDAGSDNTAHQTDRVDQPSDNEASPMSESEPAVVSTPGLAHSSSTPGL